MLKNVITLTDSNFDHYFTQNKILVVDFWAPWCEPCKDFNRLFHEIAKQKNTLANFGSINVDEEKKLAQDFSIKSVPTLAIIRNQVMVFYQSGIIPKNAFLDLLKQAINLPDIKFSDDTLKLEGVEG